MYRSLCAPKTLFGPLLAKLWRRYSSAAWCGSLLLVNNYDQIWLTASPALPELIC